MIVGSAVRAELVEHQERIERVELALADDAGQFDAGAIGRRLAAHGADDAAAGGSGNGIHGMPPVDTGANDAPADPSANKDRRA